MYCHGLIGALLEVSLYSRIQPPGSHATAFASPLHAVLQWFATPFPGLKRVGAHSESRHASCSRASCASCSLLCTLLPSNLLAHPAVPHLLALEELLRRRSSRVATNGGLCQTTTCAEKTLAGASLPFRPPPYPC